MNTYRHGGSLSTSYIPDKGQRPYSSTTWKLTFVAVKPPPFHVFEQVTLAASEGSGESIFIGPAREGFLPPPASRGPLPCALRSLACAFDLLTENHLSVAGERSVDFAAWGRYIPGMVKRSV